MPGTPSERWWPACCVYGLIGWALDGWLGTSFLVVVGILTGAGLGIFMTWKRFIAPQ